MTDEPQWRAWLGKRKPKDRFLSVVGRPASGRAYPLALSRAIRIAETRRFVVGGVVIAERHDAERSEAARLLAKGIELRLLHLPDGLSRAADAAAARRLPARLPRRGHGAEARRPHLRALRAREDACLPALARRQRVARDRAQHPRRRTRSPSRSRSAATTCAASWTAPMQATFRSASTSKACRSTATRSMRAWTCFTR